MPNHQTYFRNHGKAARFPWSLYHLPLLKHLERFLGQNSFTGEKSVLVVGPGELHELSMLKHYGYRPSVADIDERTLNQLKEQQPEEIDSYYLINEKFQGYPDTKKFDAIYAKEVIEHIPDSVAFLKKMKALLKPGGKIWLSTPNYGYFLLPFLEATFLELVARFSGFTRRGIHPNKFNAEKFEQELVQSGFGEIKIFHTPGQLALCGQGTNSDLDPAI
ncbi:MAG: class I SAM-dependent methyltransferase [Bdellovibrionales bacterium]|nr:class I SAM-dependent methyltransferase [Oligoflexia bacterium]